MAALRPVEAVARAVAWRYRLATVAAIEAAVVDALAVAGPPATRATVMEERGVPFDAALYAAELMATVGL